MIVYNKKVFASVLFVLISTVCSAAQDQAPPRPVPMGAPVGPGLPIDGGLIVLVIVAIIYGVYKILKFSRKSTQA